MPKNSHFDDDKKLILQFQETKGFELKGFLKRSRVQIKAFCLRSYARGTKFLIDNTF